MFQQSNSLHSKSPQFNSFFIFNSDFQSALTIILCLIFAALNINLPHLTSISAISTIALVNVILLVFAYILLAGSSANTPYLGLTFAMSFGSVIFSTLSHNMAFLSISISIIISPLTLWFTESYLRCLISLFTQFINTILLFRLHFEDALKFTSAEVIAEKITLSLTLTIFGTMILFGYVFHSKIKPIKLANSPSNTQNINYLPNLLFDHHKFLNCFIREVKVLTENVLGSLALLTNHMEPGVGQKLLHIALTSTEHLQRTFDNITEFGIENKKLESKATYVNNLLTNTWKSMLLFIKKKGLEGYLKLDESLPEVIAIDNNKVRQMILNLLDYFVRNTSRGFVSLTVEKVKNQLTNQIEHTPEFYIESPAECAEQGLVSSNSVKSCKKLLIFKPLAKADTFLKIGISSGLSKIGEDTDEALCQETIEDYLGVSSEDELSKLNLYVSQKMCQNLRGKMMIGNRNNKKAVIIHIPIEVLAELK